MVKQNQLLIGVVAIFVVLIGILYGFGSKQKTDTNFFVESATNIKFEKISNGLHLLGAGVRVKKIGPVGVKVYAVGLYGEPRKLGRDKTKDPIEILKKSGSGKRTLKLIFARDVGAATIVDALASVQDVHAKIQERFRSAMLDAIGEKIKTSQRIELSCGANAPTLTVSVRQAKPFSVSGANLCNAVFYLFLGPKPVSPPLLASIRSRSISSSFDD